MSMADELVNIEIDGVPVKARKGEMLIRVTDAHGAYVPRFCYHEKLSVAANCRMCLVEVEKAPKPLPACATPVMEGMKVCTKSARAIGAQRATMEFLLINHPLDCPICDQGGECELQDLAVGFGRDLSRYHEGKRSVPDENLGPLIATDMTRCIHCTRCIRFTEEIAGIQELGMIGRGEHMKVHLYREHGESRALRQRHRPVPGGRAHLQAVPLQRARLGDELHGADFPARSGGHESLRPRAARQADAGRAARERGDQRDLDRRP